MGILELPIILLLFKQNGKTTLHARSQAVNGLWISHGRIFNQVLQFEHRNHSCSNIFHLYKGHIFSQTNAHASLEDCEFEGTLRDKMPILVQPSFWFELETAGTSDGVRTTHGIWVVSISSAFAHDSPVRQNVVVESVLGVQEDRRIKPP